MEPGAEDNGPDGGLLIIGRDDGDKPHGLHGVGEEVLFRRYIPLSYSRIGRHRWWRVFLDGRPHHALRGICIQEFQEGAVTLDHGGGLMRVDVDIRIVERDPGKVVRVHWTDLGGRIPDRFLYCTPHSNPDPNI